MLDVLFLLAEVNTASGSWHEAFDRENGSFSPFRKRGLSLAFSPGNGNNIRLQSCPSGYGITFSLFQRNLDWLHILKNILLVCYADDIMLIEPNKQERTSEALV